MLSTSRQFKLPSHHRLDAIEKIEFFSVSPEEFRLHRRGLIVLQQDTFNRQSVEFHVRISDLAVPLQTFIGQCFDSSTPTEASLNLQCKFPSIRWRDNLRNGLEPKLLVMFLTCGREL